VPQLYTNNRSNSFVEDGVLYLQPTLTSDTIGKENVSSVCGGGWGQDLSDWGWLAGGVCTAGAGNQAVPLRHVG
jgi:hypothetical protein